MNTESQPGPGRPNTIVVPASLGGPLDAELGVLASRRNRERPTFNPNRVGRELASIAGLVLTGANGSGKSRFAYRIWEMNPAALFVPANRDTVIPRRAPNWEVDEARRALDPKPQGARVELSAREENVFANILVQIAGERRDRNDNYAEPSIERLKAGGSPLTTFESTVFDRAQEIWDRVFTHRTISYTDGSILAGVPDTESTYPAGEMSDGERACLYHLLRILFAPPSTIVVVDEPEAYLHASLVNRYWTEIERARPDCLFVYVTHDLRFAGSRADFTTLWLRGYWLHEFSGLIPVRTESWSWEMVSPDDEVPDALRLVVLGARRPVLLVEGTETSLDAALYEAAYPDRFVVPSGGCPEVKKKVRAFQTAASSLHWVDAKGLVDRDRMSSREVDSLRSNGIEVLPVAEVENLVLLPGVVRALAEYFGVDPDAAETQVATALRERVRGQLDYHVLDHARARLEFELQSLHDLPEGSDFVGAARAALDGVDLAGIEGEVRAEFTEALDADDYSALLRLYNGRKGDKGLAAALAKALGLAASGLLKRVGGLVRSGQAAQVTEALIAILPSIQPPRSSLATLLPTGPSAEIVAEANQAVDEAVEHARSEARLLRAAVRRTRDGLAQLPQRMNDLDKNLKAYSSSQFDQIIPTIELDEDPMESTFQAHDIIRHQEHILRRRAESIIKEELERYETEVDNVYKRYSEPAAAEADRILESAAADHQELSRLAAECRPLLSRLDAIKSWIGRAHPRM